MQIQSEKRLYNLTTACNNAQGVVMLKKRNISVDTQKSVDD